MGGILQCLKGDIALEQNKRDFDFILFYFFIFFFFWGGGVVKNNDKIKIKTDLYEINRISYIL